MKTMRIVTSLIALSLIFGLAMQGAPATSRAASVKQPAQASFSNIVNNSIETQIKLPSFGFEFPFLGFETNTNPEPFIQSISAGPKLLDSGTKYYIMGKSYSSSSGGGCKGCSSLPSVHYSEGYPAKFFMVTASEFARLSNHTIPETQVLTRFLNENRASHVWDDKWYWYRLDANDGLILYAVRGSFDSKGNPDWRNFTYTSSWVWNFSRWTVCAQGQGASCTELSNDQSHKIKGFGGTVHFDFKNPPNEHGFTGNHIMYSFGY